MRSVYFILASLSLVFSGCKKETAKNVSENPETSCVCVKENIGAPTPNHPWCHGFLIMTTYNDHTKDKPFSYVSSDAFFSSVASLSESGNATVTVDSVSLNQQSLESIKDAHGDHMYYQKNYDLWPSQQAWSIFGANSIPTFTFSADVKDPVADFSLVPGSLSKSLVKSFKINGVANITGGSVSIFSYGQSGTNVSVILREGSNEVCFPEEQLKLVSAGKASVQILLDNTMTKTFGNKTFAFSKRVQYETTILLNP